VGGYTGEGQVGTHFVFGLPGDQPAPSDYDGDGKTDPAVWRPAWGPQWGFYYIAPSSGYCPARTVHAGLLPDGKPFCSRNNWGGPPEKPVPADYDGDGKDDEAFARDGDRTWSIFPSTQALTPLNPRPVGFSLEGQFIVDYQWGASEDLPSPADYDGDGKADLTIFKPATGHWLTLPTSGVCRNQFSAMDTYLGRVFCLQQWGSSGDIVRP
jgi:hypothetical protein